MAATIRRMTDHTLDGIKGWPNPHAVDFVTKISANVTFSPVYSGRVVHLNASGQYEMGFSGFQMALFLFPNSDDPDVLNYGGDPTSDPSVWVPIIPAGDCVALVANGAYELASTEFDSTKSYPPNTCLKASNSNSDSVNGGLLTPATQGTDSICGVVSRGVQPNSRGKNSLWFWPVYMPHGA